MLQLSSLEPLDDEFADPLEAIEIDEEHNPFPTPHAALLQTETLSLIEGALQNLPPRQREAFLLRYWEGLDIAETALAMGCTEGSVKTHCSRATSALAIALKAKDIKP